MANESAAPRSLRNNFAWTLVGNGVFSASQWLLLIVIAKWSTLFSLGQFSLGLAVTGPLFQFASLQLAAIAATDAKGDYPFRDYLSVRVGATAVALATASGIALLIAESRDTAAVIMAVGCMKAVESLSDVCYGWFQRYERMKTVSLSLLARALASLAVFAVALRMAGLATACGAVAGVWLAVFLVFDYPSARRLCPATPTPSPRRRSLVRLALPMGVAALLLALAPNIPRYFVERLLGRTDLAIFAAIGYVTLTGLLLVGALTQSATPRLSRFHADREGGQFKRLLARLVAFSSVIGIAGILGAAAFGRWLLTMLYRAEMAPHVATLTWAMAAGALGYVSSALAHGITAARCFRAQVVILSLTVPAAALSCWLLIPKFGLVGAAQAWTIAMGVKTLAALVTIAWVLRRFDAAPRAVPGS